MAKLHKLRVSHGWRNPYHDNRRRPSLNNVEQAHNGAIADLRIMRRPENVSEANLAQVFAVYLQGKALHCFDDKHWYLWNGQRWQKDKQNQIIL